MVFIPYFLVGDRHLGIIVDLLCLIKLLLCLVDLHTYIFLLNFALYLGVITKNLFIFHAFIYIKQSLQLSCYVALIIFYPTHCFTFGICGPAFFTCAPTRSARLAFYLWKINFRKVGVATYFIFILKGK